MNVCVCNLDRPTLYSLSGRAQAERRYEIEVEQGRREAELEVRLVPKLHVTILTQ